MGNIFSQMFYFSGSEQSSVIRCFVLRCLTEVSLESVCVINNVLQDVFSGVCDTSVCLTNRAEMRRTKVSRLDEKANSSGMKVTPPPLSVCGTCPQSEMIC